MKKTLILATFLLSAASGWAQFVTLTFQMGILSDPNGIPVANGSLIQIIGSADTTFVSPTDTSFVGGNDVILFSGAFDNSGVGNTPGGMSLLLPSVSAANYYLQVRWFPTLTANSTTPGAGTAFGQYGYPDDINWIAPASGGLTTFTFLTATVGGNLADSAGQAMLSTAAVPEPSTYAQIALGIGALGFFAYRRRKAA